MAKLEIYYGASDDLIEIEGDIREEFNPSEDDGILAFSDGTILRVSYDNDGMWRIAPIAVGSAVYEMVQGTDPDNDYSDHAWLTGDIEWVVFGSQYAKVKS